MLRQQELTEREPRERGREVLDHPTDHQREAFTEAEII